jgi:hypothetical protein
VVPKTFLEEATLVIDGKAETSGTIRIEFQPRDQQAKVVSINVLAKMKADDIAQDIWKELKLAAGTEYKVKVKDGHKVSIDRSGKETRPFAVVVQGQSTAGVSVLVRKD